MPPRKSTKTKLPPGISVNPSGRYRVRVFHENLMFSLGTYATLTDARAAQAVANSQLALGTFVPPARRRAQRTADAAAKRAQAETGARTVRALAEEWLDWQEQRGLKLGSRYTYRRYLEAHFLDTFGERPVSDVTPEDLHAWLDALEARSGEKVTASVHRVVAALFTYAAGGSRDLPRGFVPWVLSSPVPPLPGRGIRRASARTRNRDVLDPGDLARVAACMPYREDRMIPLLCGWAGFRLGEVLALRRRHVTTDDQGTVWVQVESQVQARGSGVREESPKSTASARTVPLPALIVPALTRHMDALPNTHADALLFPRRGPGNRLNNPNTIRKRFNLAMARMNRSRARRGLLPVENFTFHGLRHTALTRLGQAGATTAELKAYAGHSDSKSVEVYQHAEKRRLAAVTAMVGQVDRATASTPENRAHGLVGDVL